MRFSSMCPNANSETVQSVEVKASVQIDSNQVKGAIFNVAAVISSNVAAIKESVGASVNNVRAQVVAVLVVQILSVRTYF